MTRPRWRRWLLASLLLVLLVPPLLAWLLLGTAGGSAWLLQQAAQQLNNDDRQLGFARSSGDLLGPLQLFDLHYAGDGVQVTLQRLRLDWRPAALWQGRLVVTELTLEEGEARLPPGDDSTEPQAPSIPDIGLPLPAELHKLTLRDIDIVSDGVTRHLDRLVLGASADVQQLRIDDLALSGEGADLQGQLHMQTIAPHAVQGSLSARLSPDLTGEQLGETRLRLEIDGRALQPQLDLRIETPEQLRVQGALDLRQVQPAFDLAAQWQRLGWPLQAAEPDYLLQPGRLTLQGTVDDYRVQLRTGLAGNAQLPQTDIDLNGSGNLQQLTLAPLQLDTLGGELSAQGDIGWDGPLSWNLRLDLQGLDPGQLLADWQGNVSGAIHSRGAYRPDQLELSADIDDLHGTLHGQPLHLDGGVSLRGDTWRADALRLVSGDNRVRVDGSLGERLALTFAIDAPQLAHLYPDLSGRLDGEGRIEGTLTLPQVKAKLAGSDIGYQGLRIGSLKLDADWREQGGTALLLAGALSLDGEPLPGVRLQLEGEPQAHTLQLRLDGDPLALELAARGGLQERRWQGQLRQLQLDEAQLGRWTLQAPVDLTLSESQVEAGNLCLEQRSAQLCAEGGWRQARGLDVRGSLSGLPLARLNRLLPPQTHLQGDLVGEFSVSGEPDKPTASLTLTPGDGELRVGTDQPPPLTVAYRDARLTARLADDRINADLQLHLEPGGSAEGHVEIGAAGETGRSLAGRLQADFPDLALVAGFVPQLQQVEGHLRLDARLAGSLQAPRVRGGLYVENGSAELPLAGLELSDIAVSVEGDGQGPLQVQGSVTSDGGSLRFDGSVTPDQGRPAVDITIKGEDFLAYRTPEAQVWLSPDLRLKGDRPMQLSGVLRIPRANVEVESLPEGSVEVSDDQVIVGQAQAEQQTGRAIQAQVRIELGDKVHFEGFGLETDLTGALDARVDDAGPWIQGRIDLIDGVYQAYGQDLTVERGRLMFSGVPGNPYVDLRALRTSRNGQVKAYLELSGPLREPRPRIYSEPPLPDAEALAYLLTGNGLDSAGREQGLDIAGAALSLGLSKGEPLLQQMSERLGLDELRVETGDAGLEGSSLILGKYLNPDLYLGYSQGLFNPDSAVLLRLHLTDRLDLESRSGAEQSVDLFYHHEYD